MAHHFGSTGRWRYEGRYGDARSQRRGETALLATGGMVWTHWGYIHPSGGSKLLSQNSQNSQNLDMGTVD